CAYPPYETGSVVGWIRRAARSQGLGKAVARAASTRGRAVPPKFGIADGTTAAERFFGQAHAALFALVLQRMPLPPPPARRRPRPPKPLSLVPVAA
ncbi:DUF6399 domain-containing protein, partial [uncultured Lamprocystis sp.]|uniref:DUF6399 domain-containing protein n=1 Tax=uncultured Lamprocystis sp. TaxID=543132 RepID=UPI0025E36B29